MIELADGPLRAQLDPGHGAELRSLRWGDTELLGQTPPAPPAPRPQGDLDEVTWTAGYRGGWQLATPNAGDASPPHGFHGAASTEPWEIVARDPRSATVAWTGHGLRLTRTIALAGGELRARTWAQATGDEVPVIAVEHLALGAALTSPGFELDLDGAPPEWRRVRTGAGRDAFAIVGPLTPGRATLRSADGPVLRLAWDSVLQPYLWLWLEDGATAEPWSRQALLLGLEPASVSRHDGIADAVARGEATVAGSARRRLTDVRLTVQRRA